MEVMCDEEFRDLAPQEIYAALLGRGEYLCSARTCILRADRCIRLLVRWSRAQPPHFVLVLMGGWRPSQHQRDSVVAGAAGQLAKPQNIVER